MSWMWMECVHIMTPGELAALLTSVKDTVDDRVYAAFMERVGEGALVREENPSDHVCAFFVPVYVREHLVFLGHHIKAGEWIPPGGHIEPGELPLDTIRREYEEELGVQMGEEPVKLFDLSVIDIEDRTRACRRHWDLWYAVLVNEPVRYTVDEGEFRDSRWMTLAESVKIVHPERKAYQAAMKKLEGML